MSSRHRPQIISRLLNPLRSPSRRTFSSPPPSSTTPKDSRSRLRSLNDRLPPFLRAYTTPLLGAPVTHITSFLILHEITAIVPLFGLVGAFHYGIWMPELASGGALDEGTQRFGRWLRKKGWVEDADVNVVAVDGSATEGDTKRERKGARLVLEFATAYALTKALLPLRIATSVWATPWFARSVLGPLGKGARTLFGRK